MSENPLLRPLNGTEREEVRRWCALQAAKDLSPDQRVFLEILMRYETTLAGFEREDVRALREMVTTFARDGDWFSADDIDRFESLATRIAALLPPEATT